MDAQELKSKKQSILADRIRGMIYGQALGDAVGLTTEFKFKRDRPSTKFPYKDSIRRFPVCDWTDDTDHMILLLETILESDHDFRESPISDKDYNRFAIKLKDWSRTGFPDLGDTCGMGMGGSTNMVMNHTDFANPSNRGQTIFQSSIEVWKNSGCRIAANGAIMRISILSILYLYGPKKVTFWRHIRKFCEITHYDARCIISCWVLTSILRVLLLTSVICSSKREQRLKNIKSDIYHKIITQIRASDIHTQFPVPICDENKVDKTRHQPTPKIYAENEWFDDDTGTYNVEKELRHYFNCSLNNLQLDELGRIGYTYKCMGCALWILDIISAHNRQSVAKKLSFKKIITRIVSECGDADTNASVAGSVLGAYLGYEQLPQDWLAALPNKAWLDEKIDKLLIKMRLKSE
jgi:ADP-ribosylglycohydrolase